MSAEVTILAPVLDDWASATILLRELDTVLAAAGWGGRMLFVDDGSYLSPGPELSDTPLAAITAVEIVHLRRNLGHQRAIAIGLAYAEAHCPCDAVVIMDADGEDRPQDVGRLLAALADQALPSVVFAERTRRSEGLSFTVLYGLYRLAHRLLTGERVRVGNFCAFPAPLLSRLVALSDLWNHFAAAVFKGRIPYRTLPTSRGKRYAGRSHMDFVALVTHGLSAMSVFGERIGVRLLAATALFGALLLAVAVLVPAWVWWHGRQLPEWAPFAAALLGVALSQSFLVALVFVFIILGGRDSSRFYPLRDYLPYVARTSVLPRRTPDVARPVRRH